LVRKAPVSVNFWILVEGVGDVDVAGGVDRHPCREAELAVAAAVAAPLRQEAAGGGELLDPAVVAVSDVDVPGGVDRQPCRVAELAVAAAAAAPGLGEHHVGAHRAGERHHHPGRDEEHSDSTDPGTHAATVRRDRSEVVSNHLLKFRADRPTGLLMRS